MHLNSQKAETCMFVLEAGHAREGRAPGGSDCLSLSALSGSVTHSVYRYLLQRTLNLVTSRVFLIFTDRASFLRAVSRKSLISLICFGCRHPSTAPESQHPWLAA